MALKILLRKKELSDKKAALEELREKAAGFEARSAEIEKAIEEADATNADEKAAVEKEIADFEAEEKETKEAAEKLEGEIAEIEAEIAEAEERQSAAAPEKRAAEKPVKKENIRMDTRKFYGMTMEERDAFFAQEDVHAFIERTREMIRQKRTFTGGEMLIPAVVLPLIRENVIRYSKLYNRVNVQRVAGQSRQPVMGAIPEAVWTEMCENLNDVNIVINGVEVDGFKVGAIIAVCNATLEDSDADLFAAVLEALSQGIGLALDKAILYGKGTKMPLGIVTRLVESVDPHRTNTTIPWTDLHTSNVIAITGKTDLALIKAIIEATGAANGKYSRGTKFWAMNDKTYTKIMAAAMGVNAAGAAVAGLDGRMPVVGGDIVVLGFVPDDVIVGGYGDLYLLAERAGMKLGQSEHVKFVEDQTMFKATARYDGLPVIADGFVAIGIGGAAPTAEAVTFPKN